MALISQLLTKAWRSLRDGLPIQHSAPASRSTEAGRCNASCSEVKSLILESRASANNHDSAGT